MKTNTINNLFAAAVCGKYNGPEIWVKFAGREEYVTFPARTIPLLRTDPATLEIIDSETGELLFYR